MKKVYLVAFTAFFTTAFTLPALAESRYSYETDGTTPADVTSDVELEVVVPQIMVLKVGDFGDFGANANDKITWTLGLQDDGGAFTGGDEDQPYDGVSGSIVPGAVTPIDVADTDSSSTSLTDGILDVGAWGNIGDLELNGAVSTAFAEAGGSTGQAPVLSEFTVTSGGTLAHPGANLSAFATQTLSATDEVVNLTDTWTYAYSAATIPAAGTWNATVTYTLSSP